MSTTKDYLVKQAAIILNASTGTGAGDASTIGAIDDPKKYPYDFLGNFAVDASNEVCRTICDTLNHPLQKPFIANSTSLADKAVIAVSGGGEIFGLINCQVDGVDARVKPVTYIKRLQSDVLSRTTIGKYFNIEGGNVVRHNGTAAILQVVRFLPDGTIQIPDSMRNAAVACLLSMATPKMDIWVSMAGYFAQEWHVREQMIRGGRVDVSPVVAYKKMDEKV